MEPFFQVLSNFGFPIALSIYLLFRFEKVLEGLQQIIRDLVQKNTDLLTEIKVLKESIGDLREKMMNRRGK